MWLDQNKMDDFVVVGCAEVHGILCYSHVLLQGETRQQDAQNACAAGSICDQALHREFHFSAQHLEHRKLKFIPLACLSFANVCFKNLF